MASDNFKFSAGEQSILDDARRMEDLAKKMVKEAKAMRSEASLSREQRKAESYSILNKSRADLSRRVENLARCLADDLAMNGLKLADNSGFGGIQTKIILLDTKSRDSVELKAVNGKGFEWGVIEK